MATHSNIRARRIPRTKEPGGWQSMGSQRVGHDWATKPPPSVDRGGKLRGGCRPLCRRGAKRPREDRAVPSPLLISWSYLGDWETESRDELWPILLADGSGLLLPSALTGCCRTRGEDSRLTLLPPRACPAAVQAKLRSTVGADQGKTPPASQPYRWLDIPSSGRGQREKDGETTSHTSSGPSILPAQMNLP